MEESSEDMTQRKMLALITLHFIGAISFTHVNDCCVVINF